MELLLIVGVGWLAWRLFRGGTTPPAAETAVDERSYDLTFNVAGVSHRTGYPANLRQIAKHPNGDRRFLDCELVREPDNPHDRYAVAIHTTDGVRGKLGYVPASLARKVAKQIDRGDDYEHVRASVYVDPEHPNRPGVRVWLWRRSPLDDGVIYVNLAEEIDAELRRRGWT